MEEPVAFESQGQKIYGVLSRPERDDRRTGVVLVHGWTGCRIGPNRILVKMARALAAEGFSVLRFDLRGRGDSEGDFDDADLDGMIADTCAALDFVKSAVDARSLAAVGLCSGGNVVIGAATLRDDVDALVPMSTLPFQPEQKKAQRLKKSGGVAKEYFKKLFRAETWKKLARGAVNFGMVKQALFGHLRTPAEGERNPKDSARDIMRDFANYRGRALFIYGGADPEAGDSRNHFENFGKEHGLALEFHVAAGSNHNFSSAEWEADVIERISAFLKRADRGER